jgi:hypothetical protein
MLKNEGYGSPCSNECTQNSGICCRSVLGTLLGTCPGLRLRSRPISLPGSEMFFIVQKGSLVGVLHGGQRLEIERWDLGPVVLFIFEH